MILLSSHIDRVYSNFDLSFRDGKHTGLLDNFLGVLVTYLVFYDDPNMAILERENKVRIFHNTSEEWGSIGGLPKLNKNDIALVIDVASGAQYNGIDFSLENISGFTDEEIQDLKESLEWEGFNVLVKKYDATPEDEDEAWYWIKKKRKTLSFIIPIDQPTKDIGWHSQSCSVNSYRVQRAKQGLKRTLNYLL